ncbi:carboxymuconolactone decarboxylase family protein [bacterium]|nr:carboxymuconolactone decarboxylase family protein [bacterium]
MRLSSPRIRPLGDDDLDAGQAEVLAGQRGRDGRVLNIFRTLVHAPEALTAFLSWGGYILSDRNSLPPRAREIVILRIGWLCRSGYEWTQHKRIGLRCGLTETELDQIKTGPGDPRWEPKDRVLLAAADELHADQFVSDPTWRDLTTHHSERQAMDLVMTAGQYTQVCMMLNTFGVQLDPGQSLDPDMKTG